MDPPEPPIKQNILVFGDRTGGKTALLNSIFNDAFRSSKYVFASEICQIKKFSWQQPASSTCRSLSSGCSFAITACEIDLMSVMEAGYDGTATSIQQGHRDTESAVDEIMKETNSRINLVVCVIKKGRYLMDGLQMIRCATKLFGKSIEEVAVLVISHCDGIKDKSSFMKLVNDELFQNNNEVKQMFGADIDMAQRVFPMFSRPDLTSDIEKRQQYGKDAKRLAQYQADDVKPLQLHIVNNCEKEVKLMPQPDQPLHQSAAFHVQMPAALPTSNSTQGRETVSYFVPCLWATYLYHFIIWLCNYCGLQVGPCTCDRCRSRSFSARNHH